MIEIISEDSIEDYVPLDDTHVNNGDPLPEPEDDTPPIDDLELDEDNLADR